MAQGSGAGPPPRSRLRGRAAREAAALAKFAAKSGLGEVTRLFVFFVAIPADYAGPLPLPLEERRHA